MKAKCQAVDDVQVGEAKAIELAGSRQKLLAVFGGAHVVEIAIGGEPHANAVGRPDRGDRRHHIAEEPAAAVDVAPIGVGALVGSGLQKLIDKIAVGGMDLHAVKSCLLCPQGSSLIVGHHQRNLGRLEAAGHLVGLLASGGVDRVACELHCRRSDRQLAPVESAVRSPPQMP